MNPLELIQHNFDSFTKTEEIIAAYVLNDPKDFARAPIETTVETCGTSKAAMIRFAKKLGYNGYAELKYELSRFLIRSSYTNPEDKTEPDQTIQSITNYYCQAIHQINETVTIEQVRTMAKQICHARRVKILAINRTSLAAQQLQMRMLKIGIDSDSINDTVMMNDAINMMNEKDYCLIFTIKDNGKHYQERIANLNDNGCPIGLVTMAALPFASQCRDVINLPPVSKSYAKFIDEQAIYFVFVEILLSELAKIAELDQMALKNS